LQKCKNAKSNVEIEKLQMTTSYFENEGKNGTVEGCRVKRLDKYETLEPYSKFKICSKKLTQQTGDFAAMLV
jgi:hypothetical protein